MLEEEKKKVSSYIQQQHSALPVLYHHHSLPENLLQLTKNRIVGKSENVYALSLKAHFIWSLQAIE